MQVKYVIDHILGWLDDYCNESGMEGFVVGISGGIDSAVTSALCAKTQKPTLAISMPILQSMPEIERALLHITWLTSRFKNVEGIDIKLDSIFDIFKKTMKPYTSNNNDLAMANSRSRIRMTALYAIASSSNKLVVGTGNKVEDFGVGFYTKHGDGGVDLSPIADLMKSQVYEIGKFMGISDSIINALPSDGLWDDGRCDEKQLGATYDELEWAMKFLEKERKHSDLGKRSKDVLSIYKHFRRKNLHKMKSTPVCNMPDKEEILSS